MEKPVEREISKIPITQQVNDDKDSTRQGKNQLQRRKYFNRDADFKHRSGKMDHLTTSKTKHGEISHSDIVKMAVVLLANGKSDFSDLDLYRKDSLFQTVLNLKRVASSATFRQRLNELGDSNSSQTLLDEQLVDHLRKVPDFGKLTIRSGSYIPLDIDVSVMLQPDCHKEKVSWTYHNAPGYAPIFCYAGTQGYMLGNELRPGSLFKRLIGQLALECPEIPVRLDFTRRRLRSILQNMICVGCKMISHANSICIKFGCDCLWFMRIKEIYARC